MIITQTFSAILKYRSVKQPKPDFIDYCNDLAKLESAHVNSDCLTRYFGFSFADLFDQTVARNKKILSILQSTQYCIIAHATPEYDPDYSHVGVYLKNHYAFSGEIMDVIAHDKSVQLTAHHLLSRFFQRGLIDHGAIILFEQPIVPVSRQVNDECYNESRVTVFLFSG